MDTTRGGGVLCLFLGAREAFNARVRVRSLEALSGLVSVARETANHAGKRGVERGDGEDKGGNASASASSSVSRIRQCLSSDDVRDLLSSRGHLTSRWDDGDEAAILTAV